MSLMKNNALASLVPQHSYKEMLFLAAFRAFLLGVVKEYQFNTSKIILYYFNTSF